MHTLEENKTVVRQFLAALGGGDVEALKRLMTDDIVAVQPGTSLLSGSRGHADICAATGMLSSLTRSGIVFNVICLTAEDERVSCEIEGNSTLVNGTPYNNQYHMLFTLREGRVCQLREYLDTKLVDAALVPLLATLKPA